MNAGADVELEAVPRADHVQLRLRERQCPLLVRSSAMISSTLASILP